MATKMFCDNPVCNKQFAPDELFGMFNYLTAEYNKQMQKSFLKHEMMYCENCTKDILKMMKDAVDKQKLVKE